jgi:hypothetical protein
MKNFLEALDINQTIKVRLSLKIIDDNGYPEFDLFLNNKSINHSNKKNIDILKHVKYYDLISVKIKMFGKKYSAVNESAITVEELSVDDINVIPSFNHYIIYNNDHNKPITTNYLGYNGDWNFNINEPFYQWYHSATAQGILIRP